MKFNVYFDGNETTVEASNEFEAACKVTGDYYLEVISNCNNIEDYYSVWNEVGIDLIVESEGV